MGNIIGMVADSLQVAYDINKLYPMWDNKHPHSAFGYGYSYGAFNINLILLLSTSRAKSISIFHAI